MLSGLTEIYVEHVLKCKPCNVIFCRIFKGCIGSSFKWLKQHRGNFCVMSHTYIMPYNEFSESYLTWRYENKKDI